MSKQIDIDSPTLVESIIKRKGGSVITFGHGAHLQTEYIFAPISSDKGAPHVCDVPNERHRAQLLSIKDGYRLYNQQKQDDQRAASDAAGEPENQTITEDDYTDLLGINAETIAADWLIDYAKNHLKVAPKAKAEIIAYAKQNWGVDLETTMTATNLIREVLKLEQKDQRAASEAAKLESR